ncbi:hypothetical protein Btru_076037 [Bulinus truncatus]|nr:hypothetical protein Btru_076037 [Bulinus truncatus]
MILQSVAYKDFLQEIQLDATKIALSGDKITFENRKRNILNSSQSKCTQKDDSAKQQTEPPKYDQNGAAVSNKVLQVNTLLESCKSLLTVIVKRTYSKMTTPSYMSSNDTNGTNFFSNYTSVSFCFDFKTFQNFLNAFQWVDFCDFLLGIALNLWLLFAILKSNDLRSSMRNKMLSCMCIQNLFECVVFLPFFIYVYERDTNALSKSCLLSRALTALYFFNEFISNWNLVLILALAVSTVLAVDIVSKLNTTVVKIGTYCILLIPWLISVAIVPPVIFSDYKETVYRRPSNNQTVCFAYILSAKKSLYFINIGVPAILIVSLLTALIILKWKKRSQERSVGDMSRQLIGQSPETDELLPYVLFVVIFFFCDFGSMLNLMKINIYTNCTGAVMLLIQLLLQGFKVFLVPLSFLVFPEIRYRAWKMVLKVIRPDQSSDITMNYVKET